MSWWDYGHYIEAIGERMPNANPFQAGVGGKSQINGVSKPGASTFFTASSEAEAINILEVIDPAENKSGARYVMSDAKMATDIFMAMASWTLDTDNYFKQYWTGTGYQYLPSERYYDSMEARLHIFDGNGMQHFRLVHESTVYQTTELAYKKIYNMIYGGNIAEVDTGFVKTFEYVKGAKIVGNATAGTKVTISTTIITNTGRQFPYSQSTVANSKGEFNFTVPYSTEPVYTDAVKRGYTYCAVRPVMSYDVNIGGNNTVLPVTEEAVMTGKTVIV
jgi:dolichyl-diphosphooligosaccharide--protein glycosyltransferase